MIEHYLHSSSQTTTATAPPQTPALAEAARTVHPGIELELNSGLRLSCRFTSSTVVSSRSWIYRRRRYFDTWLSSDDGQEWNSTSGLLGVSLTRGQRLAFAWCRKPGGPERLVAVRNCSSGEVRLASKWIAWDIEKRPYSAWAIALSVLTWLLIWTLDLVHLLSNYISQNLPLMVPGSVALAGFLGLALSCASDPDPERKLEHLVCRALLALDQDWKDAGPVRLRGNQHERNIRTKRRRRKLADQVGRC